MENGVSPRLRYLVLIRDGCKCVICGHGPNENAVLHIDHVVPQSAGGKHTARNLIACCAKCNLGKGYLNGLSEDARQRVQLALDKPLVASASKPKPQKKLEPKPIYEYSEEELLAARKMLEETVREIPTPPREVKFHGSGMEFMISGGMTLITRTTIDVFPRSASWRL